MCIHQKVHNIWSKLTVTGVSAKQSVEIGIGSLVESVNCHRTASPPDLAHCGGHSGPKSLILAPQDIPDISGYQLGFGCQCVKAYNNENPVTNQKIL